MRVLPILDFHKIGEPRPDGWETWLFIPEATFAGYLSHLRQNDWQVIDLETFLLGLVAPETLAERVALVTFDDGYRSMLTVVLPWVLQFGYLAMLFVPTDSSNTFDVVDPEEALWDWDDLREMERRDVSIQSHRASHRPFSGLALAEQEEELRRSKATPEAGLRKRVQVFSSPYMEMMG